MKTLKKVIVRGLLVLVLGFVGLIGLGVLLAGTRTTTPAAAASAPAIDPALFREAVTGALEKECPGCGYDSESKVTDYGFLDVTITLTDKTMRPSRPRAVGMAAALGIRNALHTAHPMTGYAVTVNGPSPGPGLVLHYGRARFIEGGSLEWQTRGQ